MIWASCAHLMPACPIRMIGLLHQHTSSQSKKYLGRLQVWFKGCGREKLLQDCGRELKRLFRIWQRRNMRKVKRNIVGRPVGRGPRAFGLLEPKRLDCRPVRGSTAGLSLLKEDLPHLFVGKFGANNLCCGANSVQRIGTNQRTASQR